MNTCSVVAPSVLTLLVASGCATQPKSSAGPNANQTQQASAQNPEMPVIGHAECNVDAARIGRETIHALSPAALAARNELFAGLCSSVGAHLVDVTDPTLKGHLVGPKGFLYSTKHDYYPPKEQRLGHEGNVLVALVVEVDGSTHDVTVLESSGYKSLDVAAVMFFEEGRFKTPAVLDGRPVRAFVYEPFTFHLR